MPPDTAVAVVDPAAVLPPVLLGEPSGWHNVLTDEPPAVPCPALTPTIIFFLSPAALYRTA